MDDIKLLACNVQVGKFPQKDGGGSITYYYSGDQHLKAVAVALAKEQAKASGQDFLIELCVRQVE